MQCPSCGYLAAVKDFGNPAICPKCEAIYEKALIAKAKKNEEAWRREKASEASKKTATYRLFFVNIFARLGVIFAFLLQKPLHVVILLCLFGFVAGLVGKGNRPVTEKEEAAERQFKYVLLAKREVSGRLKDAESARWGEIFSGKKGPVCGSVNAKNSFGGYTGFLRFVVSGGGLVIIESDMVATEFEKVWSEVCR